LTTSNVVRVRAAINNNTVTIGAWRYLEAIRLDV
jgi:hypothetical protein